MKKISKALRQFVADARETDSYWVEATKLQFAMALEQRRKGAGMTCKALAEKIGASGAYISKVFRGDTNMTIESMVKLARATGGHLVVRIADSQAQAHLWDASAFAAAKVIATAKKAQHTTETSEMTLASANDERFALAT
jgi:transcriptional regulator with XRE-family HTH domain